ncbi:reverse transcriptase domain-containing protein [Tanacetum coccineum]
MYLAASEESISAVLLAERGKKQVHVYFVSRMLQGAELEYPELKKLIHASRRLRRGRNSVKGEILANFLAETPSAEDKETEVEETKSKEPRPENACKFFKDGALRFDGSGAGLMLVSPEGKEYTYALRFEFETTNNEAEYEALLAVLPNHKAIPGEDKGDTQELQQLFHGAFIPVDMAAMRRANTSKEHYPRDTTRLLWNACRATVGDPLVHTKKAKVGDDTYNLSMAFLLVGNRHCGATTNSTRRCEVPRRSHQLLYKMGQSKATDIHNWEAYGEIHLGTYRVQIQNTPDNHL